MEYEFDRKSLFDLGVARNSRNLPPGIVAVIKSSGEAVVVN
jgi:hypothetical protein